MTGKTTVATVAMLIPFMSALPTDADSRPMAWFSVHDHLILRPYIH